MKNRGIGETSKPRDVNIEENDWRLSKITRENFKYPSIHIFHKNFVKLSSNHHIRGKKRLANKSSGNNLATNNIFMRISRKQGNKKKMGERGKTDCVNAL